MKVKFQHQKQQTQITDQQLHLVVLQVLEDEEEMSEAVAEAVINKLTVNPNKLLTKNPHEIILQTQQIKDYIRNLNQCKVEVKEARIITMVN